MNEAEGTYPRYLMVVAGEKVFASRQAAQNLLFDLDDVNIEGHVQVDDGYIVNIGPGEAEKDLFEAVG